MIIQASRDVVRIKWVWIRFECVHTTLSVGLWLIAELNQMHII